MSLRQKRVAQLIKTEVSSILQTRVRDPEIGFVTVTHVEISPDLRHAKVFVSVLAGSVERERSMRALRRAEAFVRTELAQALELRYAPEVVFVYDASVERAARIFQLLAEIERAREREKSEEDAEPEG